jgi:hypothetical protein
MDGQGEEVDARVDVGCLKRGGATRAYVHASQSSHRPSHPNKMPVYFGNSPSPPGSRGGLWFPALPPKQHTHTTRCFRVRLPARCAGARVYFWMHPGNCDGASARCVLEVGCHLQYRSVKQLQWADDASITA